MSVYVTGIPKFTFPLFKMIPPSLQSSLEISI